MHTRPIRNYRTGNPSVLIDLARGVKVTLSVPAAYALADKLVDTAEAAAAQFPRRTRSTRRSRRSHPATTAAIPTAPAEKETP